MEQKDKIDLLHKQCDVLLKIVETTYKKVFILLATAGGAGSTSIVMLKDGFTIFGLILLVLFLFVSLGIVINYLDLNMIKSKMKDIENEINKIRIENE